MQLTEAAENYTLPEGTYQSDSRCGIHNFLRYLVGGVSIGPISMNFKEDSDAVQECRAEWWAFADKTGVEKFQAFIHRRESLKVLRSIGLDFVGDETNLNTCLITYGTKQSRENSKKSLPTSHLPVVDSKKARQYVNIGVHIGTDIKKNPSSLPEAADAFVKVSDLVKSTAAIPELEKKIATTTDS